MSKILSVAIFLCLLYGFTDCVEEKKQEKVFYKQTASTAAVEIGHQAERGTKDVSFAIIVLLCRQIDFINNY